MNGERLIKVSQQKREGGLQIGSDPKRIHADTLAADDASLLASNSRTAQLQSYHNIANGAAPIQRQATHGGLPGQLKSGIESLSGLAMDDVRVHYNSSKPAQLQAHAYAQGTEIHIAPGQERHLPHEAWHVVQQKQGRVKPTLQLKGIAVNDDNGLEREADVMGGRAMAQSTTASRPAIAASAAPIIAQRVKFNIRDKADDTKNYNYDEFRKIIRKLDARLDLASLESLYKAMDNSTDDAQLKISKDQRESLVAIIGNSMQGVKEVDALLRVEVQGLMRGLAQQNIDAKELQLLDHQFGDTVARHGWGHALGNLESLADAVPNAILVDRMKKKLLDSHLIEREGDEKSDAKQNVAGAILNIAGDAAGPMPAWSVSGSRAQRMNKPNFGQQEASLNAMWSQWTGMDQGRYHNKALTFFGGNREHLQHERSMDSEVQVLDHYLQQLLGDAIANDAALGSDAAFDIAFPPQMRAKVLGSLVVHSDRTPCLSCGTMIDVFRRDFPGIGVFITYARDYQALAQVQGVQEITADGLPLAYRNVDGSLMDEHRSTDQEARAEKEKIRRLTEEKQQIIAAKEKERVATKGMARDFKADQAQAFLKAAKLKEAERQVLDKHFVAGTSNHTLLLKNIAAAKNETAKLQVIKQAIKEVTRKK